MHIKLLAEIALRLLLPCFVDMSCRSVQYSDRVHSIEFVSFTSLVFFCWSEKLPFTTVVLPICSLQSVVFLIARCYLGCAVFCLFLGCTQPLWLSVHTDFLISSVEASIVDFNYF